MTNPMVMLLLTMTLQSSTANVVVPPGARRVINVHRSGGRLAICAEMSGAEAKMMRRNGRKLPPTHIFIDDGQTIRKVVTGLGGCDPAWSPDGTRLAFTAPDGLWVLEDRSDTGKRIVDITGQDKQRYAAIARPRWAPDSGAIVYELSAGRASRVQAVDASSGDVLFTSDRRVREFAWTSSRELTLDGQPVLVR